MQNIVYPQGSVTVILAANESIAVATAGETQVYRNVGYPNFPTTKTLLGTVIGGAAGVAAGNNNGQTVFGPYASGASITIESGAAPSFYETGATPQVMTLYDYQLSPTPVAVNVTGAVSAHGYHRRHRDLDHCCCCGRHGSDWCSDGSCQRLGNQ